VVTKKERVNTGSYHEIEFGLIVRLREGENFESLFRRFKKKVSKDGIIRELRRRVFYEKPSTKRNRKRREAELKRRQALDEKKFYIIEPVSGAGGK
jgi:small subunit ribosomal protein S21